MLHIISVKSVYCHLKPRISANIYEYYPFTCRHKFCFACWIGVQTVTMARTETEVQHEPSHVESQSPFHRVLVERDSFLCLPSALFTNSASEARDHCGPTRQASFGPDVSK